MESLLLSLDAGARPKRRLKKYIELDTHIEDAKETFRNDMNNIS